MGSVQINSQSTQPVVHESPKQQTPLTRQTTSTHPRPPHPLSRSQQTFEQRSLVNFRGVGREYVDHVLLLYSTMLNLRTDQSVYLLQCRGSSVAPRDAPSCRAFFCVVSVCVSRKIKPTRYAATTCRLLLSGAAYRKHTSE